MAFLRTKQIKKNTYYYLVMSERRGGDVRQRHIRYIGKSVKNIHNPDTALEENKMNQDSLRSVPNDKPGVYYLYNKQGRLIYVGKAGDNDGFGLRHRISAHYQKDADRPGWEKKLTSNSKYFLYKSTASDARACELEKSEIERYEPRYNNYLLS